MAGKKKKNKKGRTWAILDAFYATPIRVIAVSIILFIGVLYGVKYFLYNSRMFDIKKVNVNRLNGYSFQEDEKALEGNYLGKNIFKVDLRKVQVLIKNNFPHLKKIEAKRVLPDVLEVDIVSREPAALIKDAGGVVIDVEGIVLAYGKISAKLPKIKGVTFFFSRPKIGEKVGARTLDRALALIKGLESKISKKEMGKIEYVDVSDKKNTIIVIEGVVVKMGKDRFSDKINRLKEIMIDPNVDLKDISYIDLRFEEAVISVK